jgi:putative ABC transport system ATP-binding protein
VAGSAVSLWLAFAAVHLWLGYLNLYGPGLPMGDVTYVYLFWVERGLTAGEWVGLDTEWVYPVLALVPMLAAYVFGPDLYATTWLTIIMSLNAVALISIIGGLLAPTSGSVTIGDTDVASLSRKQLTRFRAERVGFVFQSANLVPFLTARENLLYVAGLIGMSKADARARADQLLGELGLSERARNLPEQLSGGERQRVAIGRALMNDPDLVLVDEPTAALDTALGRQVVQLLRREIKDRGKTGIMVTHDLRMVEYTDRVFEILDGHLTHVESPSALGH